MEITTLLWAIPLLVLIAGVLITVKLVNNGGNGLVGAIATLAIVITVTALILVPAIESTDEETEFEPKWQYDDYYIMEGLESATGSLEVVSLGDTQYLHVKSIGDGTYTIDGTTYDATTTKAQLDVFMIAGQSNAQYDYLSGDDLTDADPVPSPGTAYYYGLATHPLSTGNTTQASSFDASLYDVYMSTDEDGENLVGNIEGPFSAYYYDAVGHKVLTINTGVGGSSITSWVEGGICYTHAQEVFADAMSKVDTDLFEVSVKSYLWIQGEANKYMNVDVYMEYFLETYEDLTTNSFDADYKFTYALISQTRDGKNVAIAQERLGEETGIYLASTAANSFTVEDGTLRSDELHYTQKGDNILAEDFASVAIRLWR